MAVGLILQFSGTGKLSHTAGLTDDGSLVVIEVWESRDAQGRFMAERLGRAI